MSSTWSSLVHSLLSVEKQGQQTRSAASTQFRIGFQSLPRQALSGFTAHPAMADASIHLAAVSDGLSSHNLQVPVGVGCAVAAPGVAPASCWSIASSLPTTPSPATSISMQPAEMGTHVSEPTNASGIGLTFAVHQLTTKQMTTGHPVMSRESNMNTQDITFDVQWQAGHAVPSASPSPPCMAKSRHKQLLPCWCRGAKRLQLGGRTQLGKTNAGTLPHYRMLMARRPSAAAACALQMQAVQMCMRLRADFRDAAHAAPVELQATAPTTMQLQACTSAAGSFSSQLQAAAAMALLRVAAVESSDMHRWQGRFFTPMTVQPTATPSRGDVPLTESARPAADQGPDAFGVMTHAGMHLYPRLLPLHGGSTHEAASTASYSGRQDIGSSSNPVLDRVVISGGMGALGALVATWMVASHGRSRPLLLGRSGRFSSGSVAPVTKVRHHTLTFSDQKMHICSPSLGAAAKNHCACWKRVCSEHGQHIDIRCIHHLLVHA